MENVSAEKRLNLINLLSVAAGAEGMVGGQVLDMDGEKRQLNLAELEQVHVNKTGALFALVLNQALYYAMQLKKNEKH